MNERPEKFCPDWDSNLDLFDAGAVFYQLSYQADWEMVIMWVYDKPVNSGCIMAFQLTKFYIIAQLVEHCTGIAEVSSSPVQA